MKRFSASVAFLLGAWLGVICGSVLAVFVLDTADPKFSQAPVLALLVDAIPPLMAATVLAFLVLVALSLRRRESTDPMQRRMFFVGVLTGLLCRVALLLFPIW